MSSIGCPKPDSIKLETLTHSFLVCGISNALDGSQDDLVSDDLPSVEMETNEEESESTEDDDEDDVDEVDPFSQDSDSDLD